MTEDVSSAMNLVRSLLTCHRTAVATMPGAQHYRVSDHSPWLLMSRAKVIEARRSAGQRSLTEARRSAG